MIIDHGGDDDIDDDHQSISSEGRVLVRLLLIGHLFQLCCYLGALEGDISI